MTNVFRHAAWVESSESLLTLLDPICGLVPFGIVLPGAMPPPGGLVHVHCRAVTVVCPPDKAEAKRPCCERTRVYLLEGPGTNLDSKSWGNPPDERIMIEHVERLTRLLPDEGKDFLFRSNRVRQCKDGGGLLDELEGRAAGSLTALSEVLTQGGFQDDRKLRDACRGLHGFGCGLTPTGDDLLVAVAACCRRLAGNRVEKDGVWTVEMDTVFRKCLSELPREGTTKAGSEMLSWAARGFFAEPLADLMKRIGAARLRPDELERLAGRLLRTGGRSGRDMMCGLILFLREFLRVRKQ